MRLCQRTRRRLDRRLRLRSMYRNMYTSVMTKVVSFTDARAGLAELLDDVHARHEHVVITRNGRPTAIVLSTEEWEAVEETLAVLDDDETLAALRESADDVEHGRLTPLAEVRRQLGLA